MKFSHTIFLAVFTYFLMCHTLPAQEDAKAVFKKATGQLLTENLELVMEMDITDSKGRIKEKGFKVLMANFGETRKTRVTWQKPERAKGTTVIITDADNADDTIKVFTPSNGKTRTLKATPRNLKLVGSEFGIGGMTDQNPEELTYRFIDQQDVDSQACFHIEVKSENVKDESKGELWIEKVSYRIVQIAVFDKNGKQSSLAKLSDFKQIEGLSQKFQPMRIVTEDFEDKKLTDLRVLKILSRQDLSEDDFTLTSM